MSSAIDGTKPVYGNPTTASVRSNFITAANEIGALQDAVAGAPFLPLAGGTLTGPLIINSPGVYFTGSGGVNITSNLSGSGLPAFWNTNRLIFARQTTAVGDYCDFQFQRTTSFTGGTQATLNALTRFIGLYGAGDGCNNWNVVSQAQTHGVSGGLTVGTFSTAQRLASATDGVFGAILNGSDLTGLASVSGNQVIGVEVDCEAQLQDNATNTAMFGGHGVRVGIDVAAVRHNSSVTSPLTEVACGLWFTTAITGTYGTDAYTTYLSTIGHGVGTMAYQALDTRGAIVPTGVTDPFAAVRMLHEQIIDFNGGTTLKSVAGNYLQYTTSGTPRLRYVVGASEQWSISDAGQMLFGTLPTNAANDAAAASAGVSIGGVYRNGSVLMVRAT